MKLHERFFKVRQVEAELGLLVAKFVAEHADDLTMAEWVQVLTNVFGDKLGHVAKCMIREERHGNQNDPGDIAEEKDG